MKMESINYRISQTNDALDMTPMWSPTKEETDPTKLYLRNILRNQVTIMSALVRLGVDANYEEN